ncbi:MAG: hypothetical protein ABI456_05625 [Ktedonobacteraceae bacterium]|nr:hypothetical protein [Chloroflexota bacterium]
MSHVARAIEAIGIPTVTIYIEAFLPDAQILKPARALVTANLMGRPLGLPHQREQQIAVIHAALEMLQTADHAPTLKMFTSEK